MAGLLLFVPTEIKVYADELQDRANVLRKQIESLIQKQATVTDPLEKDLVLTELDMTERQFDAANAFLSMRERVRALAPTDPRVFTANKLITEPQPPDELTLEAVTKEFIYYQVLNQSPLIEKNPYRSSAVFNEKEKQFQEKITAVNHYLFSPQRPGVVTQGSGKDKTEIGGVPKGDLFEDFIPGVIRILFRFASLGVLVAFVVSGVMYVLSFGNDDSVQKAKRMLYYSIIGFAFVALAFAIVKAITNIDFFGFI